MYSGWDLVYFGECRDGEDRRRTDGFESAAHYTRFTPVELQLFSPNTRANLPKQQHLLPPHRHDDIEATTARSRQVQPRAAAARPHPHAGACRLVPASSDARVRALASVTLLLGLRPTACWRCAKLAKRAPPPRCGRAA